MRGAVAATLLVLILSGCRQLLGIEDDFATQDAPTDTADAPPGSPDGNADARSRVTDVAHLGTLDEALLIGTGDYAITTTTTIDTAKMNISPPPPGGVVVFFANAEGGGPPVLVIGAGSLTISALVVVTGDRPLILVAETIALTATGTIDASAAHLTPGPGGAASSLGIAPGAPGTHGTVDDSGGGGGGFGSSGGAGGTVVGSTPMAGGAGGLTAGDDALTALVGGSGGGGSSRCPGQVHGGAAGGALQLTSRDLLAIDGSINVGGGGGEGGLICNSSASGGGGGGSGGAIYLQAGEIVGTGTVAANGGGGAGGATQNGPGNDGQPGADAGVGTSVAPGGAGGGATSWAGGAGAAGTIPAAPGADAPTIANTGGGGGGAGRIVIRATITSPALTASPPATAIAP